VRPTSIWGPWFGVPYRTFFDSVLGGRYIHPKAHTINKSFGFVGNTIFELEKLLAAESALVGGKTFFLGDAPPIEVLTFANAIRAKAGKRPIREVPSGALRVIARVGDVGESITGRSMPLTTFRLDNLETEMVYDLKPLLDVVGELPYAADEGVDLTLEWMNAQESEKE
jgi:nucleoside-diphosphate-sugar epimerase